MASGSSRKILLSTPGGKGSIEVATISARVRWSFSPCFWLTLSFFGISFLFVKDTELGWQWGLALARAVHSAEDCKQPFTK
jgi:hypothetical protein